MWQIAATVFVIAGILGVFVSEILRYIVHKRRERRYGYGGTQEIAMSGSIVGCLLVIGAILCGTLWLLTDDRFPTRQRKF